MMKMFVVIMINRMIMIFYDNHQDDNDDYDNHGDYDDYDNNDDYDDNDDDIDNNIMLGIRTTL